MVLNIRLRITVLLLILFSFLTVYATPNGNPISITPTIPLPSDTIVGISVPFAVTITNTMPYNTPIPDFAVTASTDSGATVTVNTIATTCTATPATLPANASCVWEGSFLPNTATTHTAQLNITFPQHNYPYRQTTSSRTGTATTNIQMWGLNQDGELGNGTSGSSSSTPVTVVAQVAGGAALSGISQVVGGANFACALLTGGTVKCWGANNLGQLGDDSVVPSTVPVSVSGLTNVNAITAGDAHACALLQGGTVECWGDNSQDQLGNGTTGGSSSIPVAVTGLTSPVTAIVAGGYHTCALLQGGTMQCWGLNSTGQLGDGTQTNRDSAVAVINLNNSVTAITAGGYHTCALLSNSTLQCWGDNGYGQLGNDTDTDSYTPTDVKNTTNTGNLTAVKAITAGAYHTCALMTDSSMLCWGFNYYGQLGNAAILPGANSSLPVNVMNSSDTANLTNVTAITAGADHACAQLTGNTMQCWGDNANGELGDGTTNSSSKPIAVQGLSGSVASLMQKSQAEFTATIVNTLDNQTR